MGHDVNAEGVDRRRHPSPRPRPLRGRRHQLRADGHHRCRGEYRRRTQRCGGGPASGPAGAPCDPLRPCRGASPLTRGWTARCPPTAPHPPAQLRRVRALAARLGPACWHGDALAALCRGAGLHRCPDARAASTSPLVTPMRPRARSPPPSMPVRSSRPTSATAPTPRCRDTRTCSGRSSPRTGWRPASSPTATTCRPRR